MPWECVVVADSTLLDMPVYGLIYYKIEIVAADGKRVWRYKAEFYDDEKVYYYIENDSGNYIPYTKDGPSEEIHGFSLMPLIKFNNNLLNQGDFETVRALCDGYDNALSYALNDNESFSNALMVFKDVPLTQTLIDQARYLRGIQIDSTPTKPDPSVTYLTKDIQIDNTETLTDILSEDIFKFSSTIDIYDEAFSGGNVSGESRKQQLIPLELKCKETERLFQHSLMQMFTVISTYWAKLSKIIVKPEEIDFIFIRSIIPTEQTIEQLIQLKKEGIISIETVLSKLSFIDDPQDELERLGKLLPTNTGE
jgi:SPP1 family phage portal protein